MAGRINADFQHKSVEMPTKSKTMSKSSRQSPTGRGPGQSRCNQSTSFAATMDTQISADPCLSYSSNLPHRNSNRNCPITKCVAPEDEFSYNTSYARNPFDLTDPESSFLTIDMPSASDVTWDNEIPMDNLILDQCQPFMTNEPYQYSETSGSLTSGSQSMFYPLALDPSINFSTAAFQGYNVLAPGMTDYPFKD